MGQEKTLVIVESNAKAKTINKYLGKRYRVLSSMGHLVDLPKSRLAIDIENNFEPDYITVRGRGKILENLKKEAIKSKEVLIASDNDREGEAIAWNIQNTIWEKHPKLLIKRILFNEITKQAITKAVVEPKEIDLNKVNAQKARRVLDRLVGYNLSPLLWEKLKKGLSAGRVQSASLKLLCDREEAIEKFEKKEYWKIKGLFKSGRKEFEAQLVKYAGKKVELGSEKETNALVLELKKEEHKVSKVEEKARQRGAYAPYTTSRMQQEGSIKLGFAPSRTMQIAQSLYEGVDLSKETVGLVTYIRTDSTRVSNVAIGEARDFIKETYGKEYLPEKYNIYINKKKGVQDAHEAIRPTSVSRTPESISKYLTKDQLKLYSLIWNAFVSSQMQKARYKQTTIELSGAKSIFRVVSTKLIFKGFLEVYGIGASEANKVVLPKLKEGEEITLKELNPSKHYTEPPPRYSEASMVSTLEESGVGRPSTYAPTLQTLVKRYYVSKKQRQLVPTELGKLTNELISKHFPKITDIKFTANIEEDLDKVEESAKSWVEVLHQFYYNEFLPSVKEAKEKMQSMKNVFDEKTDELCEKCGRAMVKKLGRYGYFLACTGFPECRNAKSVPICGCPLCEGGKVVEKKAKKKTFYGCSNYPECKFVSWTSPEVDEKCSSCGKVLFYKAQGKGVKGGGAGGKKALECKNTDCVVVKEAV